MTVEETRRRKELAKAQRIVIKVGTTLVTHESGRVNLRNIDRLARAIASLMNQGKEVILVTSGAIGVGVGALDLKERPQRMRDKQAIAAVGQCELMNVYSRSFAEYGYVVAQVLLTRDDLDDKTTKINITNTFGAILERRIIPIVNENDTVSTDEIMQNGTFGDNDTLSAHVAILIKADLLIVLSDIDGLFDCDPKTHENAKRIPMVDVIDRRVLNCAHGTGSKRGTGGMKTKLTAMVLASSAGIGGVIAGGDDVRVLEDIIDGMDVGTFFVPHCKIEQ